MVNKISKDELKKILYKSSEALVEGIYLELQEETPNLLLKKWNDSLQSFLDEEFSHCIMKKYNTEGYGELLSISINEKEFKNTIQFIKKKDLNSAIKEIVSGLGFPEFSNSFAELYSRKPTFSEDFQEFKNSNEERINKIEEKQEKIEKRISNLENKFSQFPERITKENFFNLKITLLNTTNNKKVEFEDILDMIENTDEKLLKKVNKKTNETSIQYFKKKYVDDIKNGINILNSNIEKEGIPFIRYSDDKLKIIFHN